MRLIPGMEWWRIPGVQKYALLRCASCGRVYPVVWRFTACLRRATERAQRAHRRVCR